MGNRGQFIDRAAEQLAARQRHDANRVTDLAVKVATKAEEALRTLQIEMDLRGWPNDLRKIMWQAVADTAAAKAANCE